MKDRPIAFAVRDLTGKVHHHPASWIGGIGHRQRSGVDGDRINVACKERHCSPEPARAEAAA